MDYSLLNLGLIGPALFILTALIFGCLRPKYNQLHNTISELALGKYGYVQTVNFALNGLLIAMLGLRLISLHEHAYGAGAVIVMGVVLMLSAVYRTDPITANGSTATGKVHNGLFFIGILGIISGQFITGVAALGTSLGLFSLVCGALTLTGLVTTITRRTYMGLFQRVLVTIVMVWISGFAFLSLGL